MHITTKIIIINIYIYVKNYDIKKYVYKRMNITIKNYKYKIFIYFQIKILIIIQIFYNIIKCKINVYLY